MDKNLIPQEATEIIEASNAPALLQAIRPHWQAKSLINRVKRLLEVDPSSACQRLLNAAIHDLREKVIIAGIDIASEAASQNKLPPISNQESIENYPTSRLIDLTYRMGIFTRPEWRRISRCYEIRRDLEHEDDEYEAGIEDCVYIFKTCVDVVLSRDPIQLIKVTDFKDIIEQASAVVPDRVVLEDYECAPKPRQEEILKFLISHALNKDVTDLVQQNAYVCISYVRSITHQSVLVKIGEHLQDKSGRNISHRLARVAQAAGVFVYLRKSARLALFEGILEQMKQIGYNWSAYRQHGEVLMSFSELGGLESCPSEVRAKILKWLILVYVGQPGGVTQYGNVRHVYYSNTAAPRVKKILSKSHNLIRDELIELRQDKEVDNALTTEHIERRYEELVDIVENASVDLM